MSYSFEMEEAVISFSDAAAVETEEAYIQATGLINTVEALGAVFTIDRLSRSRA